MLIRCDICDANITESAFDGTEHVCDRDTLKSRIEYLEASRRNADADRNALREAMLRLMADNAEEIERSTHPHMKLLQNIWQAAGLCWYDKKEMRDFSASWMHKQMILCGVIELFSGRADGRGQTRVFLTLTDLFNNLKQYLEWSRESPEEFERWAYCKRTPEKIAAELAAEN